ncbi:PepSY domain-containing protein [Bacillus sp. PS06]|uniref:PepSY domain-containing protein n=1 Tax=Bacillus sp. PS06 TaxID=2764176 RepID=UPI0017825878|nr:PepSY domain-containing protein [Bacillus sp. PS06]MBD8070519.1 PepSY domain-containing protein [Bacillus sp. PS06]
MKKKLIIGSIVVAGILILIVVYFQFITPSSQQSALTQQEMIQVVEERYQGIVDEIIPLEENYKLLFSNELGSYEVTLDSQGKVIELQLIEANEKNESTSLLTEEEATRLAIEQVNGNVDSVQETTKDSRSIYSVTITSSDGTFQVEIDRATGETLDIHETSTSLPTTKISEKEAIAIALAEVNGEVDDVELEEDNGTYYYEVEIEYNDKDVVITIDAYTGKILSITWEN